MSDSTMVVLAVGAAALLLMSKPAAAAPAPTPEPAPTGSTAATNDKPTTAQRIAATGGGAVEIVGGIFRIAEAWA